jgi:phosphoribosyl-dephospho-CoA transferase
MRRHDLLRITPAAWQRVLQDNPALLEIPLVADWASHGWPVIIRRHMPGDQIDDVPAALPLPPLHGKRRVAFCLTSWAGVKTLPPVSLSDAAAAAPASWQPAIAALLKLGERMGKTPNVFGALLWEHITGLPYMTAHSDIDLLWNVADPIAARALVDGLLNIEKATPLRLDGELELPDGGAVNWRELAQVFAGTSENVLVKCMAGVSPRGLVALFLTGLARVPAISTRRTA